MYGGSECSLNASTRAHCHCACSMDPAAEDIFTDVKASEPSEQDIILCLVFLSWLRNVCKTYNIRAPHGTTEDWETATNNDWKIASDSDVSHPQCERLDELSGRLRPCIFGLPVYRIPRHYPALSRSVSFNMLFSLFDRFLTKRASRRGNRLLGSRSQSQLTFLRF